MPADILTVETPSGTVRATAEARGADAVVYALGGALRGCVHVTGTHHPRRWDQFTALRASLGSVNAMEAGAPAESLPRRRGSATGYTGSLVRWPDTDDPRSPATHSLSPVESAAGNAPSPATGELLALVLRACAEDVAHRPGLADLLDAARRRETPSLLRFLAWARRRGDAEASRYERDAQAYRRDARATVTGWWMAARWLTAPAHPAVALLLKSHEHRAACLLRYAEDTERAGREERQRVSRLDTEISSLRAQQWPPRRTRRPVAQSAS
ncbi:hypothetical protein ACFWD7_46655 [Streptomyces mirabilis]|uniref:hypothetical protein n=1 Tax=Streptomyces mirabilis TaxID=68239 RepID=UPI0036B9D5F6